jgi:FKBP-type peptidyl-prolyl cis-trans isomerase FkpA
MKRALYALIAVAALAAGCGTNYKKVKGGYRYVVRSKGSGPALREGQWVEANLRLYQGDSLTYNTYDMYPTFFMLQKPDDNSRIFEVMKALHVGDSATIVIPADSVFKGGQMPPFLKKGATVRYELKINKVFANQDEANKAAEAYNKAYLDKRKVVEAKEIDDYMAKNNLKGTRTANGTVVVIEKEGTGELVQKGQMVAMNYTGRLMKNGTIIDSNVDTSFVKDTMRMRPYEFITSSNPPSVIMGWDEGVLMLKKGSKAKFLVPAMSAYGPQPNGAIPAFSNLTFDVEVMDVKAAPKMPQRSQMPPMEIQAQPADTGSHAGHNHK